MQPDREVLQVPGDQRRPNGSSHGQKGLVVGIRECGTGRGRGADE